MSDSGLCPSCNEFIGSDVGSSCPNCGSNFGSAAAFDPDSDDELDDDDLGDDDSDDDDDL
ncbi:MAG: hypothetical protein F2909_04875 [Actinobacteria bacterium]|uniref:Unannotated protein n=1 Tax=freshwater metagenome TaxID=449393 RepID=A0A6J7RPL3_9ZZZZ|nr:hypothetical protein [Actinomycetota bacterium]